MRRPHADVTWAEKGRKELYLKLSHFQKQNVDLFRTVLLQTQRRLDRPTRPDGSPHLDSAAPARPTDTPARQKDEPDTSVRPTRSQPDRAPIRPPGPPDRPTLMFPSSAASGTLHDESTSHRPLGPYVHFIFSPGKFQAPYFMCALANFTEIS